jgi:hypothetical protein
MKLKLDGRLTDRLCFLGGLHSKLDFKPGNNAALSAQASDLTRFTGMVFSFGVEARQ